MKSLKEMTLGDWYKLVMTGTSLAAVVVGELLPETSGNAHKILVEVGSVSATVHGTLLKPEIATLLLKSAGAKLFVAAALVCAVVPLLAAGAPVVEPGTFHNCGLDGTAKQADLKVLNHLKNRATVPDAAQVVAHDLKDFYAPGDDTHRFDVSTPMRVRAVISDVKVGGIETVNCKATDPQWRDTHIELCPKDRVCKGKARTALPIIVEVSPRWRAAMQPLGVDWSTAALKHLIGKEVIVEGWPLFDGEHANQSENTAPGGAANWRQTAWEPAHPVTSIQAVP